MLETAAQFTVNEGGDQFGSTSLLGRDEFDQRLAVVSAQVIWPLAIRRHLKGTIYGHAQMRADELGLAKREVLRWWDSYQYKGMLGVLPASDMPPKSRKRLGVPMPTALEAALSDDATLNAGNTVAYYGHEGQQVSQQAYVTLLRTGAC